MGSDQGGNARAYTRYAASSSATDFPEHVVISSSNWSFVNTLPRVARMRANIAGMMVGYVILRYDTNSVLCA